MEATSAIEVEAATGMAMEDIVEMVTEVANEVVVHLSAVAEVTEVRTIVNV